MAQEQDVYAHEVKVGDSILGPFAHLPVVAVLSDRPSAGRMTLQLGNTPDKLVTLMVPRDHQFTVIRPTAQSEIDRQVEWLEEWTQNLAGSTSPYPAEHVLPSLLGLAKEIQRLSNTVSLWLPSRTEVGV